MWPFEKKKIKVDSFKDFLEESIEEGVKEIKVFPNLEKDPVITRFGYFIPGDPEMLNYFNVYEASTENGKKITFVEKYDQRLGTSFWQRLNPEHYQERDKAAIKVLITAKERIKEIKKKINIPVLLIGKSEEPMSDDLLKKLSEDAKEHKIEAFPLPS